ncbi:ATP synthase subunit C lysine N-methyltransferase isoform X2 [Choloepus didactylus]|uniref:ATP synthase subunit C lysine N-methyltransferase isoform X2 n=1 Tax=Choloepus didactylus TaxID=27675 RepID=UPI00189F9FA6|nr:ATP synthase subunit C lysine N-methyltransferase isoform X2 [Choloepus didactylus]
MLTLKKVFRKDTTSKVGEVIPVGLNMPPRYDRAVIGSPLEALKEEGQSGYVPPTCFEANSLKKRNWGLLFTGIVGGSLVAVYAVATPFVTPALRKICLPFVPATPKQIENVLTMLHCRRGSVVDIGSGDGRIVIAAAKEGFMAVGYELNPWLVWYSRYRAWREGVHNSAKFYISDLWKVTFSQYTNIVIFGVPQMMPLLERKLELELVQDARVIACRFPFPHWIPDHVAGEGVDTVWAYDAGSLRGRRRRAGPAGQSQSVAQV